MPKYFKINIFKKQPHHVNRVQVFLVIRGLKDKARSCHYLLSIIDGK